MLIQTLEGLLLPFAGTALGAAFVFIAREGLNPGWRRGFSGFAGGIMTAASFFSLLLPALEQSADWGGWAFIPACVGFFLGMAFLMTLDAVAPETRQPQDAPAVSGTGKMILAVTLHNLPEGMAVGVLYAGWMAGNAGVTLAAAWTLALGVAVQNLPEGAIVSLPLRAQGMGKSRAFLCGVLSGAVEPVGGAVMILFTGLLASVLPWLLSFAAGAMISVVMNELIPDMRSGGGHGGEVCFAAGFALMMALDVGMG